MGTMPTLRAVALAAVLVVPPSVLAAPSRGKAKGPAGSSVKVSRLQVNVLLPSGQLYNSPIGEGTEATSVAPIVVQFELANGKKPESIQELMVRLRAAPEGPGSPGELDRVSVKDVQAGNYLFTFMPKQKWPDDFCQGVLVEVSGQTDKGPFVATAEKLSIGWCAE